MYSQEVSIIPKPVSLSVGEGKFALDRTTKIVAAETLTRQVTFLNDYLKKFYGFTLNVTAASAGGSNAIVLANANKSNPIPGAYKLNVSGKEINLTGDDPEGVFYGVQTLIQLLPR